MSKRGTRPGSKQGQSAGKTSQASANKEQSTAAKSEMVTVKAANGTSRVDAKPTNGSTKPANGAMKNDAKPVASAATKQTQPAPNTLHRPQTKQSMKQERRQQKLQSRFAEQQRVARRRRFLILALVALVVCVGALGSYLWYANTHASPTGSQNPAVAPTVVDPAYQPIDGIYCESQEQLVYHIHAHLTIYIDGQPYQLPQGIGISPSGSCLYWLHVHATDGVIHIESPTQRVYTLQNFLDIWQSFAVTDPQTSFPTQLSTASGWTIYVNGHKVSGDFSKVKLNPHDLITIMYNSPDARPDTTYNWPAGE